MRQWFPALASVFAALVVQVALVPHLAIGGVVPNVFLLVIVTFAFVEGASAGLYAGFAAGLLLDFVGNGPIGAWALVLGLTGYVAGLTAANVFAEGWLLPVTVAGLAGLIGESAYAVVLSVLGEAGLGELLATKAVPGALYTTVLALLAYPWLARFLRRDVSMKIFKRIGV